MDDANGEARGVRRGDDVAAVVATAAAAGALSVPMDLPQWGLAVALLALCGARWSRLAARAPALPVVGMLAIVALGAAALVLHRVGAAGWATALLVAAAAHGVAHGTLLRLGRSQEVAAYGSAALLGAGLLALALSIDATGPAPLAERLTTAWNGWLDVAEAGLGAEGVLSFDAAADAGPAADTEAEFFDQLRHTSPFEVFGLLLAWYVILATLLAGYLQTAPRPYRAFIVFRANERQTPLIILALAAEALRTVADLPALKPYTVCLLYLAGGLVWLQALAICLAVRAQAVVQDRPGLRLVGAFGIASIVLMHLFGALVGLLDIYFNFRKLTFVGEKNP